MLEKANFWKKYGLMIWAMLLYGVDLLLIVWTSQQLYKNIVEITMITVLPLTLFVIWLLRSKAGKEKERQEYLNAKISIWIISICFFAVGLGILMLIPYSLEWGYCFAMAAGVLLYYTCLRKRIPNWGQRISELYVCIFSLELIAVLLFPFVTGLKTVNQAEAILVRQGYEDIHYAVNTHPYGLELIFDDDAPELTLSEKKSGFYVFSAREQGKEIGVIVSPASGRIVQQARLSDNLVLDLMIHR